MLYMLYMLYPMGGPNDQNVSIGISIGILFHFCNQDADPLNGKELSKGQGYMFELYLGL